MSKLAGQMLTARGVAAFWLTWCAAFVLMLWAVSPGRTLQDALAAELLQGHLAGGYQVRNPPLYEWLLWSVQQISGPGPLSYLVLRYALIAATGLLFYVALLRTVASQRLAAAFSLSLVLLYWFGWEIHHSVSHSLALLAASLALFIAALAYAERPTATRAFFLGLIIGLGLMAKWSFLLVVLSLGRGARHHARDAAHLSRSAHAARARRSGAADPSLPAVACQSRSGPDRPPRSATGERPVGGAVAARSARLHYRHSARVSPVDRLRAVLRLALSEDATVTAGAASSSGDKTRRPHGDNDARGHGSAAPVRDGDGQRAVRHYPLRHPLPLPVLAVRGAGAVRPRGAARERGAICAEACAHFARHRASSFSC